MSLSSLFRLGIGALKRTPRPRRPKHPPRTHSVPRLEGLEDRLALAGTLGAAGLWSGIGGNQGALLRPLAKDLRQLLGSEANAIWSAAQAQLQAALGNNGLLQPQQAAVWPLDFSGQRDFNPVWSLDFAWQRAFGSALFNIPTG
jgi:hypothetical protein